MPFALNAATRHISPTKTPEFLAAGLPVVSTPIVDVVRSWGADGLVEIADTADATVTAITRLLANGGSADWRWRVDARLASSSWDRTWGDMAKFVAVVNYLQTEAYTRVTEYKHLTGQRHPRTSISYEYPSATGDPYYPIPRAENTAVYKRYEVLANARRDVWFVGRLATYRYYNMDQVVGQALATFERIEEAVPARAALASQT
jgi:hypothetical protein